MTDAEIESVIHQLRTVTPEEPHEHATAYGSGILLGLREAANILERAKHTADKQVPK